jgi:hypothetical protein
MDWQCGGARAIRPAVNQYSEPVNDIVDLTEAMRTGNQEDLLGI